MMWIRAAVLLAIFLGAVVAHGEEMYGPAVESPVVSAPLPEVVDIRDRKKKCQEDWKRYRASQRCFARYRLANGGVRAEAFQHCKEVKQPDLCE
jgi:hypothetical protein